MKTKVTIVILLLFIATSTFAGVTNTVNVDFVSAPSTLEKHLPQNETTRPIIFEELKNVTLLDDVDGVPAGTLVNSYMLFWDTPGTTLYDVSGTVFFDEPILAVLGEIDERELLNSTHSIFGLPTTYYPSDLDQLDRCTSCRDDVLIVDLESNSVYFEWIVGQSLDAVRILTLATPEIIQNCSIDAPVSVNENDPFTATVTCTEQVSPIFGFEFAHSVDPSSPPIMAQTTTYDAGDIFTGKADVFTLINDLNGGFAQSLLAPEVPLTITNSVTLGGVTYDTDLPGTVTLNLDTLILGDQSGLEIPTNVSATTVVEILDLQLAEVEGRIQRETGADTGAAITLTIDTVPPTTTSIVDDWMNYAYPEIVALDGLLEADAPGHLHCSQTLNLEDEILNILPDIVLLAGDVNDDDEINIADGAIIVSARIGDSIPSGSIPDLNEDTEINILDLIHVGRNFGEVQPNVCFE
jgi:hypothetical protein